MTFIAHPTRPGGYEPSHHHGAAGVATAGVRRGDSLVGPELQRGAGERLLETGDDVADAVRHDTASEAHHGRCGVLAGGLVLPHVPPDAEHRSADAEVNQAGGDVRVDDRRASEEAGHPRLDVLVEFASQLRQYVLHFCTLLCLSFQWSYRSSSSSNAAEHPGSPHTMVRFVFWTWMMGTSLKGFGISTTAPA